MGNCKRVVAVGARAFVGYVEERCFGYENATVSSLTTGTPHWLGRMKRIDVLNESIATEIGSLSSEALNPKRAVLKRVQGQFAVGGDIGVELSNDGFVYLITQAIGRILISDSAYPILIIPVAGSDVNSDKTAGYLQNDNTTSDSYRPYEISYDVSDLNSGYQRGHYIVDAYAMEPGMTFIIGRDPSILKGTDGSASTNGYIYFKYTGMRVNTWSVSATPNEIVSSTFSMLGKEEEIVDWTEQSGYEGANDPFTGFNAEITLFDDVDGTDALSACVLSFEMTLNNNIGGDQYCLGEKYRNSLPETVRTVEGTVSIELVDLVLYDKFINGTAAAIKAEFELSANESLTILLPYIEFNGTTPQNAGREVINLELPYTAMWSDSAADMLSDPIWATEAADGFDVAVEIKHTAAAAGYATSFI